MRESTRRRRKPTYKSCSFTGHRPQKLPFGENERDPRCVAFKQDIHDVIENLIGQGFARFVSGGARGFDTFAAEAVLDLKENYPIDISLPVLDIIKKLSANLIAEAFILNPYWK